MNETKDYYTFAEIITGLRSEYQNNQKILQEILELTAINMPFKTIPKIYFTTIGYNHDQSIRLELETMPPIKYRVKKKLMEKCGLQYQIPFIIYPTFILKDTNACLNWEYSSVFGENCSKNISVHITDAEKIRSLINELKETNMYNFNEIFGKINGGQLLTFSGSCIKLSISTGGKTGFNLAYNAISDTIEIASDIPYNKKFIYHALSLKLPKYLFSDAVIKAIEEKLDSQESLNIIDDINYCKERATLEFSSQQKLALNLKKQK